MRRRIPKVYADTSVYGGVFDEEFEEASKLFFKQVDLGIFELISSPVVMDEIQLAPQHIIDLYNKYVEVSEFKIVDQEIIALQEQYLKMNVVGKTSETDALHVAFATVFGCSVIVSWNFKDIVHFQKIPLYNAIIVVAKIMCGMNFVLPPKRWALRARFLNGILSNTLIN